MAKKKPSKEKIKYNTHKRFFCVTEVDFYRWFKDHEWEGDEQKMSITRKQYKKFFSTLFKLLRKKIIEENFIFNLPFKLGTIYIRKNIGYHMRKRFKLTELNKPIEERSRYPNRHSFGDSYSIYWEKEYATIKNKGLFTFEASAKFKQDLKNHIFELSENNQKSSFNSHLGSQPKRVHKKKPEDLRYKRY